LVTNCTGLNLQNLRCIHIFLALLCILQSSRRIRTEGASLTSKAEASTRLVCNDTVYSPFINMRSIAFLNIIRQDFVQNINGEVSVHFGRVLKFSAEAFPSFSTPKRDVVSQFYDNICKFSSNIESCFLNQIQFPGGEGGEFQRVFLELRNATARNSDY
jgi:hypothetical protein